MSEPQERAGAADEAAPPPGESTPTSAPPTPLQSIQSYVDKWLTVQPAQHLALVFVKPERYLGHLALAALEQEIIAAAYGIREPTVALNKLNWWAEELSGAMVSGGHHPLTQVLFADPRAQTISADLWMAPALEAMRQFEDGTAADFAAQLAAATPMHGALARLETAWWYGPGADPARAEREAVLSHILHVLRRLEDDADRDRLPLPMAQLARYGMARNALATPSAGRNAAIGAQLDDIRAAWRDAARLPGPLSVFRALEAHEAMRLLRRARHADDVLKALQHGQHSNYGTTWAAWRAASRWRRLVADV